MPSANTVEDVTLVRAKASDLAVGRVWVVTSDFHARRVELLFDRIARELVVSMLWTRAQSFQQVKVPAVGPVSNWVELTDVALPYVSFHSVFVFEADGTVKTSNSTLRFRDRSEVECDLEAVGFAVGTVRDAPDRPGREFVFVARRTGLSDRDP